MSTRFSMRASIGALAAFGTMAAHALAYFLVQPDPGTRARLLDATGHEYRHLIASVVVGAFVAGLAGYLREKIARSEGPDRTRSVLATAARLAVIQSVVFILVESTERLAGGGAGHVADTRIVLAGLTAQLVVACFIALFLACVVDPIAARLARSRRRPRARRKLRFDAPRTTGGSIRRQGRDPRSTRAPPLDLVVI